MIFSKKKLLPFVSILSLIDKKTKIHPRAKINRFAKLNNSTIEKYSYIGPRTKVINTDVGKFCSISWDCEIGLTSHNIKSISTSPIFSEEKNGTGTSWIKFNKNTTDKRVKIGNDVWIGARVIIMNGTAVGHGAVIAAGAIVTKDVPPYAIIAGVPAKIISYRFSQEIIQKLLLKEWWELPDEEIIRNIEIFSMNEIKIENINMLPKIQGSKNE